MLRLRGWQFASLLAPLLLALLSALLLRSAWLLPEPPRRIDQSSVTDASRLLFKYKDCNLVFVSFDALQAAHVGCLGAARKITPTLDAFASKSFSFTSTFSVSSWTVPASMTWFTGVYPSEHRMTNKFAVFAPPQIKSAKLKELSPNLVTLAEIMQQNGYATAGFTGNAGVSGGFGYEQGFGVYVHEKNTFGGFNRSAARAIDWLRQHRGQKFFLFLHGYDVHGQFAARLDYRFVDPAYDRRYTGAAQEQELLREEGLDKGQLTLRSADVEFWRAVYDEKINRLDAEFATFLAEFERLGLSDSTVFVITSDHGTEFYEHRRFDHGFTLYSELLHVPLFIRFPGQHVGKVIDDRIGSIDVMPTILDLLDVRVPERATEQMRGSSLTSAMKGAKPQRDIFSETDYREYTYKRCIITPDGWKFIVTLESGQRELYDLNSDPKEALNVLETEPHIGRELEQKLFAYFKSIGHDLTSKRWEPGFNPVYTFPIKQAGKS